MRSEKYYFQKEHCGLWSEDGPNVGGELGLSLLVASMCQVLVSLPFIANLSSAIFSQLRLSLVCIQNLEHKLAGGTQTQGWSVGAAVSRVSKLLRPDYTCCVRSNYRRT